MRSFPGIFSNLLTLSVAGLVIGIAADARADDVWVDSYTKRDGTHVSGHWRSAPGAGSSAYSTSTYSGAYIPTSSSDSPTSFWTRIQVWHNGETLSECIGCGYGPAFTRQVTRCGSGSGDKGGESGLNALRECKELLREFVLTLGKDLEEADNFANEIFAAANSKNCTVGEWTQEGHYGSVSRTIRCIVPEALGQIIK
jgi:hypothetical protein